MHRGVSRSKSGAVLPIIVVASLLFVAYLAFAVDVNRTIFATQKLQFAAESAALDAYSKLLNPDGTPPGDMGAANARTAVNASHGAAPWNQAPLGPANQAGPFDGGVTIDQSDVNVVPNPSDAGEPLLQVTARRTGNEALRYFFLPAIFAMNGFNGDGDAPPPDTQSASPYRTIEVVGAPASRIGAGAPRNVAAPGSTAGWATLPIAISYSQFQAAAAPGNGAQQYVIDMLDSTQPFGTAVGGNRMRGAFVNVAKTGSGSTFYGDGQGNVAINELLNTWRYFGAAVNANEIPPAVVERGSQLAVFDDGDSNFRNRTTTGEIQSVLRQVPVNKLYIVPVIDRDPVVNSRRVVVGFALLRLDQAVDTLNQISFRFTLAESWPVRNATSAMGASVPNAISGTSLPAPPATGPFANRVFDMANNAISPRYRGVAMAPVVSPRSI